MNNKFNPLSFTISLILIGVIMIFVIISAIIRVQYESIEIILFDLFTISLLFITFLQLIRIKKEMRSTLANHRQAHEELIVLSEEQSSRLLETKQELEIISSHLNELQKKLLETRENQDLIGQILTTSSVQIEAAKKLMETNVDLAVEKINTTQLLLHEGLEQIRKDYQTN